MSTDLIWKNLVAYCLQVGLLVGLAAFVPAALRLRTPRGRLAYWQILLAACLALPLVQTWRQEAITGSVEVSSVFTTLQPAGPAAPRRMPAAEIALWILAAGAAARLLWLAAGFSRLWLYRRRSQPYRAATPWNTRAELCISEDIASPVTFGVWNPVVLLPAQFPELDRQTQDAILCHELLHVDRRDWLFTVGEELVRVVFWFHPAIWWLLGEIQLAREQAVDREVIDLTQARDEYVDALLTIAGARPQCDLAPAPLFLRKRHLKQRVVSILKDGRMSRTRLVSALAAGLGILAMACWLVTSTFPLAASPQIVSDADGVSVNTGGTTLLHRTPVRYPEAARAKGIQGTVAVEATLDSSGNVSDARVLSGPEELRKAALESVLGWHFANGAAGMRRQVMVAFQLPAAGPAQVNGLEREKFLEFEARVRRLQAELKQPPRQSPIARAQMQPAGEELAKAEQEAQLLRRMAEFEAMRRASPSPRTIKTITSRGLSPELLAELLSKLPVRQGDAYTPEARDKVTRAVLEFDEHMTVFEMVLSETEVGLQIATRDATAPERIRVGGNVQQARLIRQPRPLYPMEAKQQRIQGVVKLSAIIGKDGTMQQLDVISGHPLLVPAALEAVKQWVYQITLLNDAPVEVATQIDINFTLSY